MKITNHYVFDAEQLSFKKLDDDNITWVTIKGNHVPIPKSGTREQKAEAIKQWFASKKKDLPQAKGRMSFYSAKVEHDVPKASARGTGEHAQVHGEGQYTLKFAKNNYENYFKKFGLTKTLASSLTVAEKQDLRGWHSNLFGDFNSAKTLPSRIETSVKKWEHEIENLKADKEKYHKINELSKEEAEKLLDDPAEMGKYGIPTSITDVNELWRWSGVEHGYTVENIRQKEKNIENAKYAKNRLEQYLEEGKIWEESAIYTVGGKIYQKDFGKKKTTQQGMRYWQINKLYNMPPEEREKAKQDEIARIKEHIANYEEQLKNLSPKEWGYNWDKRSAEEAIKLYNKELDWWEKLDVSDINPAKAQMSKVELPASKTYLREATSLRGQSNYIKKNVKEALIDGYRINKLRDYGLNDIADEFESIIDDAVGLNSNNSSGEHIESLLLNMPDKFSTGFKDEVMNGHHFNHKPQDYMSSATPYGKREENVKLNEAKYLVDYIASNLRVTLLALKDNALAINNGRGLYDKLGRILANEKTKSYWGASQRQGQLTGGKLLQKHGISGIAYTGHGRSRVSGWTDGEGNVTFDPSKIKVLEKTTDPAVIEQWIKEQEQHGQRAKK